MKHDAGKLKLLRESMGMTQEKLAILSSVHERTVQRAEAGATMSLETLNDFAAALEVPISELVYDPDTGAGELTASLRRVTNARSLVDDLGRAGAASFECEVDPTSAEMDSVLALVELIEARLPRPWDWEGPDTLSLRDKIQLYTTVSGHLSELTATGIGLFTSTSWISAKYPFYDMEEGIRCTRTNQRYERVTTLQLLLSRSSDDKIYRRATSNWGLEEEPATTPRRPLSFDVDLDDDVPF